MNRARRMTQQGRSRTSPSPIDGDNCRKGDDSRCLSYHFRDFAHRQGMGSDCSMTGSTYFPILLDICLTISRWTARSNTITASGREARRRAFIFISSLYTGHIVSSISTSSSARTTAETRRQKAHIDKFYSYSSAAAGHAHT